MRALSFDEEKLIDDSITSLQNELPPIFARSSIPKYIGNVLTTGTLANLSSQGLGAPTIRSGRNTVYERNAFVAWMRIYLTHGIDGLKNAKEIKNE